LINEKYVEKNITSGFESGTSWTIQDSRFKNHFKSSKTHILDWKVPGSNSAEIIFFTTNFSLYCIEEKKRD